jgi:hypothetical protein
MCQAYSTNLEGKKPARPSLRLNPGAAPCNSHLFNLLKNMTKRRERRDPARLSRGRADDAR